MIFLITSWRRMSLMSASVMPRSIMYFLSTLSLGSAFRSKAFRVRSRVTSPETCWKLTGPLISYLEPLLLTKTLVAKLGPAKATEGGAPRYLSRLFEEEELFMPSRLALMLTLSA